MNDEGKRYRRLDRAERGAIERGLDGRRSAREIARDLGRAPSTVAEEVRRNRVMGRGPTKGERVAAVPDGACPKLLAWPHVCNGCRQRRYNCRRPFKCVYSSARAQSLADSLLADARRGVDRPEAEFEAMMATIASDLARGLSPAQIAKGRSGSFSVHPSTIYRWLERGYAGMSNLDLRRKVGYKERDRGKKRKATSHGPGRSYAAFCSLNERKRDAACEMDTVMGRARDRQCVLTLFLRPCRFQLCLLLPEKTSSAVAAALDMLEALLGKAAFQRMFGTILTDNGAEFSDHEALESSSLPGKKARCEVYYCDVRASEQKAGCERNHVELRKILPKRRGISFDDLVGADMAVLMSHLNSEPRTSMGFMTPIRVLVEAYGDAARTLLEALGVEELPYERLRMDLAAIEEARIARGDDPLL